MDPCPPRRPSFELGSFTTSFLWQMIQARSKMALRSRVSVESRRLDAKGSWECGGTDLAALDAFYALHLRTRRKLGVPTQPKRFIRRFEELFAAGLGFVWTILEDDQPVAAAVFLTHNGTVTYKYGASDERALNKRPNNLLLAEAIRWSCEAGFHTFDFGRTEVENEGLRAFKSGWGAEEVELPYTYFSDHEPAPESALRERIMSATIRHSPAVVGRLVGEALYRHVA